MNLYYEYDRFQHRKYNISTNIQPNIYGDFLKINNKNFKLTIKINYYEQKK